MRTHFVFFFLILSCSTLIHAQRISLKLTKMEDIQSSAGAYGNFTGNSLVCNDGSRTYLQTGIAMTSHYLGLTEQPIFEISLLEYQPKTGEFKKIISYLDIEQIKDLKKEKKRIVPYYGWVSQGYWYMLIGEHDIKAKVEVIKLLRITIKNSSDIRETELGTGYNDFTSGTDYTTQLMQWSSDGSKLVFVRKSRESETKKMKISFWALTRDGKLSGNSDLVLEDGNFKNHEILSVGLNSMGKCVLLHRSGSSGFVGAVAAAFRLHTVTLNQANASGTDHLLQRPDKKRTVHGSVMINEQDRIFFLGTYNAGINATSEGYFYASVPWENLPAEIVTNIMPWDDEFIKSTKKSGIGADELQHNPRIQLIEMENGDIAFIITLTMETSTSKSTFYFNKGFAFIHLDSDGNHKATVHLPFYATGLWRESYYPFVRLYNEKIYLIFNELSANALNNDPSTYKTFTQAMGQCSISAAMFDPNNYSWSKIPVKTTSGSKKDIQAVSLGYLYSAHSPQDILNTSYYHAFYFVDIE